MIPWTLTRFTVPLEEKHPHIIMFPPPCLTAGTVFLGLYTSPFILQTYSASIWPNNSNFVSSNHMMVDQKLGSCFRWSPAKAKRHCNHFLYFGHAQDVDVGPNWAPSSWPWWSPAKAKRHCNHFLYCGHAQDVDVGPNWAPSSWPWWSETENDKTTLSLFILLWKDAILVIMV